MGGGGFNSETQKLWCISSTQLAMVGNELYKMYSSQTDQGSVYRNIILNIQIGVCVYLYLSLNMVQLKLQLDPLKSF